MEQYRRAKSTRWQHFGRVHQLNGTRFRLLRHTAKQRSTLSEPNSVSEQALSQQLPLRLIEGVMEQCSSIFA
jgi:hypothetical protein